MRRGRQDMNLFNFSFLDILATTIGVIVFLMVLALLDVGGRTDRSSVPRAALPPTQPADTGQAPEKPVPPAPEPAPPATAAPTQPPPAKPAEGVTVPEGHGGAISPDGERQEQGFRIPEAKPTQKLPVLFECDGGKVYTLAFEGNLDRRNYTAFRLGRSVIVTRLPQAYGETFEQTRAPLSSFQKALARMTPDRHVPTFIVRADSFQLYRDLRSDLWDVGFDLFWEPHSKKETLVFGAGTPTGGRTM